eukprot:CAMPEP_0184560722 /NCGR_PEP_ID=MMETSP0199_2-20130426/47058_1 /TAXON_ID=1112570 /ORGANISM="Thraustochytrium sp., Strain LLF1b" /LENGTH=329 /DNA_ID=CAMNT_0026958029 /DNA_START=721 /DNA_END=1710 /DNA_ORIENTATION=-
MSNQDLVATLNALRGELRSKSDDEATVLELLKKVDKIEVTRDLLKDTGIGKTVNKLASDERQAVRETAQPLLKRWKALSKTKGKASGTTELKRSSSCISENSIFSKSAESQEAGGDVQGGTAQAEQNPKRARKGSDAAASPKVQKLVSTLPVIPLPADPKRKRTCELLEQLFANQAELASVDAVRLTCRHIEAAMAIQFGASTPAYKSKYRTLKTNLNLNKTLKEALLRGTLLAKDLVKMSDSELLSDDRKAQMAEEKNDLIDSARQDWLDSNRDEIMKAMGVSNHGGLFKCGRCGSKKTTHYQKQTRSADEPMTVFIQCSNCPHRWRQ